MGTYAYIGIHNSQTDTVELAYCHYDGYPSHTGRVLAKHYQDPEKVAKLVALGGFSALTAELDDIGAYDDSKPQTVSESKLQNLTQPRRSPPLL